MPVYIFINLGTISTTIYKIMNHVSADTHQSSLLHESDGSHATRPSSMDIQSCWTSSSIAGSPTHEKQLLKTFVFFHTIPSF